MPIGPYADWDACIADQVKKGKSKKDAQNICGFLEKRAKGEEKMTKNDWRKLNFVVPITESVRDEQQEFVIRGTAINSITTRNKVKYTSEELRKGANSLKGKPILKDHSATVDSIVGKVTKAEFNTIDKNINFEGIIKDEIMREKISDGLITSVSVGAIVEDLVYDNKEDEGCGVLTARGIDFVELSLVAVPADPNAGFVKAIFESYKLKQEEQVVSEAIIEVEQITQEEKVEENKIEVSENVEEEQMTEEETKQKAKDMMKKAQDMMKKAKDMMDKDMMKKAEDMMRRAKDMMGEESVETNVQENIIMEESQMDEELRKTIEALRAEVAELKKPVVEEKADEEKVALKAEIERMRQEKVDSEKKAIAEKITSLEEENKKLREQTKEKVETKGQVVKQQESKDDVFANNYVFENSALHMGDALWQDPTTYTQETLKPRRFGRPGQ